MTKPLSVLEVVTNALQSEVGQERNAAKKVARMAQVNERTAQNWLYKKFAPQADQLVRLMAANDRVRAEINCLVQQLRGELQHQHEVSARMSRESIAENRCILSAADRMDREAAALGGQDGARDSNQAAEPRGQVRTPSYVGPGRRSTDLPPMWSAPITTEALR